MVFVDGSQYIFGNNKGIDFLDVFKYTSEIGYYTEISLGILYMVANIWERCYNFDLIYKLNS